MKIAYNIQSIGFSGGIERVLSTKTNYFADQLEYEVHIIVAEKKPDSLFFHFSEKIHFHYLDIEFSKRSLFGYFFPSKEDKLYRTKLEELLFQIKPDITVSMFGTDASFLYKINDGSEKVLEFHFTKNYLKHLGDSLEKDRFKFIRKYWLTLLMKKEEFLTKKYDHIVVLTERDKQLWGGGDKFTAIPNPLSFHTEKKSTLDNNTIISMGRLVYPKGFQYLIRAYSLIHEQFPEWKVKIYGEGHDRELLQNEINKLSLQGKISLEQPDEDVEGIMLNASLFVLPTLYDGFGLVLTEAMVCGVPCVAFDCECGPGEIIADEVDGFLAELKNIEDLASKMRVLMENNSLREKMGKKAKENSERFLMEEIGEKWNVFFRSLLAE